MILLIVEVGFWWQNVRIRTRTHKHMHSYTNSLVFSANEITHIYLLLSRLGYVTTKFLMAIMLAIVRSWPKPVYEGAAKMGFSPDFFLPVFENEDTSNSFESSAREWSMNQIGGNKSYFRQIRPPSKASP